MPRERGRTLTTRLQFFFSCVRFETVSATVIKTPHPTYFQTTCDPCDAILCTIYRQLQFSLFFTAPLKLDRDSHDELTQSFSLYFSFFVFVVFVCFFFIATSARNKPFALCGHIKLFNHFTIFLRLILSICSFLGVTISCMLACAIVNTSLMLVLNCWVPSPP